jgi:hypothetical protein
MKNSIVSILALGAIAVLPLASMAATYHYVDTSGTVRTIEANNAADASASATNIDPHSGVSLDMGVLDSGDSVNGTGTNTVTVTATGSGNTYHYVDTSGIVRTVVAASAAAALAAAVNIAPNSGVVTDTGALETGVSVTAQ